MRDTSGQAKKLCLLQKFYTAVFPGTFTFWLMTKSVSKCFCICLFVLKITPWNEKNFKEKKKKDWLTLLFWFRFLCIHTTGSHMPHNKFPHVKWWPTKLVCLLSQRCLFVQSSFSLFLFNHSHNCPYRILLSALNPAVWTFCYYSHSPIHGKPVEARQWMLS